MDEQVHNSAGAAFVLAAAYWCQQAEFRAEWLPILWEVMLYRRDATRQELEALVAAAADPVPCPCDTLTDADLILLVAAIDGVDFVPLLPT